MTGNVTGYIVILTKKRELLYCYSASIARSASVYPSIYFLISYIYQGDGVIKKIMAKSLYYELRLNIFKIYIVLNHTYQ